MKCSKLTTVVLARDNKAHYERLVLLVSHMNGPLIQFYQQLFLPLLVQKAIFNSMS
nr:hypothetical protein Clen_41 [Cedratvirus lena]WIL04552.1 hypothetical protein Cduv_72 [Cedratvirus duvanny]